jgi:hypothetical protein
MLVWVDELCSDEVAHALKKRGDSLGYTYTHRMKATVLSAGIIMRMASTPENGQHDVVLRTREKWGIRMTRPVCPTKPNTPQSLNAVPMVPTNSYRERTVESISSLV